MLKLKNALAIILCIIFPYPGFNQSTQKITRLDGSVIEADSLTKALAHLVDTASIMGLSVIIINDNRVVYRHYFGTKDTRTHASFTDRTVSYAASMTKPLFAMVFMKLVGQKIFDLDKPVYTYLKKPIAEYPKWKDLANEPDFKKITPRMLLCHSSGLPILRFMYGDTLKLVSKPGALYHYSNEGMNLLGFVTEEYTGRDLQALAKTFIYDPLQMNRTGMVWQKEFDDDYSFGHDKKGTLLGAEKRTSARGAGSMVTTVSDYAVFVIQTMERKGLPEKMYRKIFTPQISVTSKRQAGPLRDSMSIAKDPTGNAWGLGWALHQSPYGQAFRHGGHADGWQNYCVAYPDKKTALVIFSNSDNYEHAGAAIAGLCIGDRYSPFAWMGYFDN